MGINKPEVVQAGLISDAAGSAYMETGNAKVICAVYGPKPTAPSASFNATARLNVDVKFAPFSSGVRRYVPGKDTESSTLSHVLQQSLIPALILDALPKSQIDLFLTILESDGSENYISAGITAASVALTQAGIPMRGLVTAVSAVFLPNEPFQPVLDPNSIEAHRANAVLSLACLPALGTLTHLMSSGSIPLHLLEETCQKCIEVCGQIHDVTRQSLLQHDISDE